MAEQMMLPGKRAMPDLIYDRRDEYIAALREVDASARINEESPDFSADGFIRQKHSNSAASFSYWSSFETRSRRS
jgi:hypothetical protein